MFAGSFTHHMKDSCFNRICPIEIQPEATSLFKDQSGSNLHKVRRYNAKSQGRLETYHTISPRMTAELYLLLPFVYLIGCQVGGSLKMFAVKLSVGEKTC